MIRIFICKPVNQAQNDLHIIKQLKEVGQKSDKFADIMLVHVNCHSFRSRLLSLQTQALNFFHRLIRSRFCFDIQVRAA